MTATDRLSRGVAIKGVSNGVALGLGFVLSILLNRILGKDTYGLLVLVYSVTALATILSHLGVKPALNRFVPKFRRTADERIPLFITIAFMFQLAGIALVSGLLWIGADPIATRFFHRAELAPLLRASIPFVAAFSLLDFVLQLFQAFEDWRSEGLLSVVYPLVYLVAAGVVVGGAGAGLVAVLVANALAAALAAWLGWMLFRRRHRWQGWRWPEPELFRATSVTMLGFGAPLLVGQANFFLLTWFDKALLGRYGTLESVTFYYIAASFLYALMTLFKVLFTVVMPYLAGVNAEDREGVERRFVLIFRWFLQTAVVAALLAYFAVEPVILALYGTDYWPAVTAFRWLLPVFLLRAIHNPSGMFVVNVFARTGRATSVGVILAALNVALNLVLLPAYGMYGAIWASIAAYVAYWVIFLSVFGQIRRMLPYKACLRTAAVVVLVVSGAFVLTKLGLDSVMVVGPASLLGYLALLVIFREVQPRDIVLLKGSVASLRPRRAETSR